MKHKIAKTVLLLAGLVGGYYFLIGATCWTVECMNQPWHPYIAIFTIGLAVVLWALEVIFSEHK